MTAVLNLSAWRELVWSALGEFAEQAVSFLPQLVATLFLLSAGWVISRLAEGISARVLLRLGFDRLVARGGIDQLLRRAGVVSSASQIVARILFWVLMLIFALSAVEVLGLRAVTATLERFIAYVPNVLGAGLILVFGMLAAHAAGNLVRSGAAVANLTQGARLGGLAHAAVVMVALVLAIEQVGIRTEFLMVLFTAVATAMALTLGAAFALGARPVIGHVLAGHFLRESLHPGLSIEVEGRRGVVERVGSVETRMRDEERVWSIPNARLLEEIVGR